MEIMCCFMKTKEEENGFVMFLQEEILLEKWDEEFVNMKGF